MQTLANQADRRNDYFECTDIYGIASEFHKDGGRVVDISAPEAHRSMKTLSLLMAQYDARSVIPLEWVQRDYFTHLTSRS
jgi:hypothetical protein